MTNEQEMDAKINGLLLTLGSYKHSLGNPAKDLVDKVENLVDQVNSGVLNPEDLGIGELIGDVSEQDHRFASYVIDEFRKFCIDIGIDHVDADVLSSGLDPNDLNDGLRGWEVEPELCLEPSEPIIPDEISHILALGDDVENEQGDQLSLDDDIFGDSDQLSVGEIEEEIKTLEAQREASIYRLMGDLGVAPTVVFDRKRYSMRDVHEAVLLNPGYKLLRLYNFCAHELFVCVPNRRIATQPLDKEIEDQLLPEERESFYQSTQQSFEESFSRARFGIKNMHRIYKEIIDTYGSLRDCLKSVYEGLTPLGDSK